MPGLRGCQHAEDVMNTLLLVYILIYRCENSGPGFSENHCFLALDFVHVSIDGLSFFVLRHIVSSFGICRGMSWLHLGAG